MLSVVRHQGQRAVLGLTSSLIPPVDNHRVESYWLPSIVGLLRALGISDHPILGKVHLDDTLSERHTLTKLPHDTMLRTGPLRVIKNHQELLPKLLDEVSFSCCLSHGAKFLGELLILEGPDRNIGHLPRLACDELLHNRGVQLQFELLHGTRAHDGIRLFFDTDRTQPKRKVLMLLAKAFRGAGERHGDNVRIIPTHTVEEGLGTSVVRIHLIVPLAKHVQEFIEDNGLVLHSLYCPRLFLAGECCGVLRVF